MNIARGNLHSAGKTNGNSALLKQVRSPSEHGASSARCHGVVGAARNRDGVGQCCGNIALARGIASPCRDGSVGADGQRVRAACGNLDGASNGCRNRGLRELICSPRAHLVVGVQGHNMVATGSELCHHSECLWNATLTAGVRAPSGNARVSDVESSRTRSAFEAADADVVGRSRGHHKVVDRSRILLTARRIVHVAVAGDQDEAIARTRVHRHRCVVAGDVAGAEASDAVLRRDVLEPNILRVEPRQRGPWAEFIGRTPRAQRCVDGAISHRNCCLYNYGACALILSKHRQCNPAHCHDRNGKWHNASKQIDFAIHVWTSVERWSVTTPPQRAFKHAMGSRRSERAHR